MFVQVLTIYEMCQFDHALVKDNTKFCSLLSEDSIALLDYNKDLTAYYKKGYGVALSYEMGCPLLKEIFSNLDHAAKANSSLPDMEANEETPAMSFRFAHAETIYPILALLGLYRDSEPLTADWTPEQIKTRQWRSGKMVPFTANLGFELYKCKAGPVVSLLHNEQSMPWPAQSGCEGYYCQLSVLLQHYRSAIACPFAEMCGMSEQSYAFVSIGSSLPETNKTHYYALLVILCFVSMLWGVIVGYGLSVKMLGNAKSSDNSDFAMGYNDKAQ